MRHKILSFTILLLFTMFGFALCGCRRDAPREGPVFDVPSLGAKRIGQVEKILGAPAADDATLQMPNGAEAHKTWRRDGFRLSVHYGLRNNRVTNFLIAPDDASQSWSEKEKAARLNDFNLREGDARYSLEWIEDANKPLRFSALRVTLAPIQYKIVLRVSGTAGLVAIRYAPLQAADAGGDIMTVPPWETSFSAQTGTVLSLEAGPLQGPGVPFSDGRTTVQVIVDGRVMAQKSSEGGIASCSWEL